MQIKAIGIDKAYLRKQHKLVHLLIKVECFVLKKITSSVYDCTVEDVEYIHVVIALTGAHMQPACVTELTSSEY